jgi:hypothetical protein
MEGERRYDVVPNRFMTHRNRAGPWITNEPPRNLPIRW